MIKSTSHRLLQFLACNLIRGTYRIIFVKHAPTKPTKKANNNLGVEIKYKRIIEAKQGKRLVLVYITLQTVLY